MLIAKLKSEQELLKFFADPPVFVFKCYGCKEVYFPFEEVERFLSTAGLQTGSMSVSVDYICNYEFAKNYIKSYHQEINRLKKIVVFSCGVGVQTVSAILTELGQSSEKEVQQLPTDAQVDSFRHSRVSGNPEHNSLASRFHRNDQEGHETETLAIKVYAGCDTFYINGFQGLTAERFNCNLCGECLLNYTGGICPITACSKSLLNGPCGGAKNGKCEVDKELDCGWEKIYRRLENFGKLNNIKKIIKVRDYYKMFT